MPGEGGNGCAGCFRSRNEIQLPSHCWLVDSLKLDAADGPLADEKRLGRFNCLALLALVGNPVRALAAQWLADLNRTPLARRASLVCSASPVGEGAVLRLAGECFEEVSGQIHRWLASLDSLLDGDPWARKW